MNSSDFMSTTIANAATVEHAWFVIDAEDQILGRMATRVATALRGKHKPTFTPHVDTGDYVIVINAEKIKLTLSTVKPGEQQKLAGFSLRQVKFEGFDPFQTKAPLTTYLEVYRWYRPEQKQTAVLILRSARPRKDNDPVWKKLHQFRAVIK